MVRYAVAALILGSMSGLSFSVARGASVEVKFTGEFRDAIEGFAQRGVI